MPLYCSYVTFLCIESKKNVKCNNKIKKLFSKKTRSYPFFIFSFKVCPPFSKKKLHTRSRPLKKSVKDLIYKHHLNIVQTTDEQPKILNIFSNSFSSNVCILCQMLTLWNEHFMTLKRLSKEQLKILHNSKALSISSKASFVSHFETV